MNKTLKITLEQVIQNQNNCVITGCDTCEVLDKSNQRILRFYKVDHEKYPNITYTTRELAFVPESRTILSLNSRTGMDNPRDVMDFDDLWELCHDRNGAKAKAIVNKLSRYTK